MLTQGTQRDEAATKNKAFGRELTRMNTNGELGVFPKNRRGLRSFSRLVIHKAHSATKPQPKTKAF
jgi:hypothetical protein